MDGDGVVDVDHGTDLPVVILRNANVCNESIKEVAFKPYFTDLITD